MYLNAAIRNSGKPLRKICGADGVSYLVDSVDDIKPEHRVVIAILDAMEGERVELMDNELMIACKSKWMDVSNYWIFIDKEW